MVRDVSNQKLFKDFHEIFDGEDGIGTGPDSKFLKKCVIKLLIQDYHENSYRNSSNFSWRKRIRSQNLGKIENLMSKGDEMNFNWWHRFPFSMYHFSHIFIAHFPSTVLIFCHSSPPSQLFNHNKSSFSSLKDPKDCDKNLIYFNDFFHSFCLPIHTQYTQIWIKTVD